MTTITFDTNVWRRVVKHDCAEKYANIRDQIFSNRITPYICEIAVTLEAIMRLDRALFFSGYQPNFSFESQPSEPGRIHQTLRISPNTEVHPGLPNELCEDLHKAKEMGFKVLRMTNYGTVRTTEIPTEMYATFGLDDGFWPYANTLAECANFICNLGCGQSEYLKFKQKWNQTRNPFTGKAFSLSLGDIESFRKLVVAEWVDGDSISAHYAAGIEFFCTDDRAKKTGKSSILHRFNREQLTARFGIQFVSSDEINK